MSERATMFLKTRQGKTGGRDERKCGWPMGSIVSLLCSHFCPDTRMQAFDYELLMRGWLPMKWMAKRVGAYGN